MPAVFGLFEGANEFQMTRKRAYWKAYVLSLKEVMRAGNYPFGAELHKPHKTGPIPGWTGQLTVRVVQQVSDRHLHFLDCWGSQNWIWITWEGFQGFGEMVPINLQATKNRLELKNYANIGWKCIAGLYSIISGSNPRSDLTFDLMELDLEV